MFLNICLHFLRTSGTLVFFEVIFVFNFLNCFPIFLKIFPKIITDLMFFNVCFHFFRIGCFERRFSIRRPRRSKRFAQTNQKRKTIEESKKTNFFVNNCLLKYFIFPNSYKKATFILTKLTSFNSFKYLLSTKTNILTF
jgi:hypothetical protein